MKGAKNNPIQLRYNRLSESTKTHLRMYSDAAFKKEEDTGHCMRGAMYLRCPGTRHEDFTKSCDCHILEFVARQQRRVVRSTFTAELLGACDTLDKASILVQMLHECSTGHIDPLNAVKLANHCGYSSPFVLYLDALSVYASITATFIKTPADNSALCHLQYIREMLDRHILTALCWVDTRDMIADGLTKGTVDRAAIHECMAGTASVSQAMKLWHPKMKPIIETNEVDLVMF